MANKLSRRHFLKVAGTAAGAAAFTTLLSQCAPAPEGVPAEATPIDKVQPTPEVLATADPKLVNPTPLPTATAQPKVLMNENREGFYIRYYNPFEPVDVDAWVLRVDGMVDEPQTWNYEDMLALPYAEQISRMRCVEGWSVAAKWQGFTPQTLVERVKPKEGATWVQFHCADDYYESLPLAELMLDRVLFVHGMNGELLQPEYGSPLRLIVPFKYAYKGPKAITRISFADRELKGYWPTVGPYTTEGDITPGVDYAIDLDDYQTYDTMGEIFYEDGIESQSNSDN